MSRMLSFVDRFCAMGLIDRARQLMERGRRAGALKMLRRAGELGEDHTEVIGQVADALHELGELREAGALLQRVRFRHGRNPRFQQIWNAHRFQIARAKQMAQNAGRNENFILPFVRPNRVVA